MIGFALKAISWFGPFKAYAIAIAAAAALATVTIYIGVAERNRALVKAYEQDIAEQLQTIEHQDEQIRGLHNQIRRNNELTMARLKEESDRLLVVKAEVERVQAQRDAITAELAKARQDWQEAIANDETIPEFIAMPVPGAVWRRLRDAAGNGARLP